MIRRTSVQDVSESAWFKSSYSSNGNEGDCVEVAASPGTVHVRDSKNAQGPRLAFGPNAWAGFVSYAAER
ncbi:DUF397 domain-containing protein [Streptomyces sp. NBC_00053]|uniref:DUF397 domain-containing protein n=1 Tax=unclassified Streptomyces TaxID=2593676 RepID=UPI000F5BEE25|nr:MULTISPECIES: DUF397 domain-containing protein [unclassified Streptomyces]WSX01873.1 DUF397 domain-containing protein [Streptomyces sp. NBC_00987]MCX4396234.1 DUF397 domain-containing protein [Streptomyces sp. NBC_01767]MCX5160646.1 DUF397 domain-containing protein [Streptomyces sp. NBC_00305]MCX5219169.1 DUF397 domain-containing protein [Streptomyces sp. NBC_00264]MCX5500886.1 DUF397 domain-containing protein [Streptomyces sp. NBC_00052]